MFHSAHALCFLLLQRFVRLFRPAKWARWALAAGLAGSLAVAGAQGQAIRLFRNADVEKKYLELREQAKTAKDDAETRKAFDKEDALHDFA